MKTWDMNGKLTIQIVRRHEQFQAQLGRDVDVRHVLGVLVLFVVVKVLAYFLEHEAAVWLSVDDLACVFYSCVGRAEKMDG
jgi:hypothetical protein